MVCWTAVCTYCRHVSVHAPVAMAASASSHSHRMEIFGGLIGSDTHIYLKLRIIAIIIIIAL